jgi:hypothetical protein
MLASSFPLACKHRLPALRTALQHCTTQRCANCSRCVIGHRAVLCCAVSQGQFSALPSWPRRLVS